MNVGILFTDFGPYHVARIQALATALVQRGDTLFAYRFAAASNTYGWEPVVPNGVEVITLAEEQPATIREAWNIATAFRRSLKQKQITACFLPSYSPLPNFLCLLSSRSIGCKAILMSESWSGTERSNILGRAAKHLLVRSFSAALVGGTRQRDYVCSYGQSASKVFFGYDVVDVNYYSQEAKRWKVTALAELPVSGLPERYFLNIGRFVPKKNLAVLIEAYAKLAKEFPTIQIGLALVGEGSDEVRLKQIALELGLPVRFGLDANSTHVTGPEVIFYPFQQISQTPLFFARCEAFILPSLFEEWGLVVNEAMACGAAVLVSENVGSAPDLVAEGENGFIFDPNNSEQLANHLEKFIGDADLSRRLGTQGAKDIIAWGPRRFASGALQAIDSSKV